MASESESSSAELKQRVVDLEHQRVRVLKAGNTRCAELEGQVTHLRMLLEQSEAARRQTDLQAAAARSHAEEESLSQSAKVTSLRKRKADLEAHLAAQSSQLEKTKAAVVWLRAEHDGRAAELTVAVKQKDASLDAVKHQLSEEVKTRQALESKLGETEKLASSLQGRFDRLANENISQREVLTQQLEQLEGTVAQNKELVDQAKCQGAELATLREQVEAERSSHLQSKFNCEVIQLRLKDVETIVDSERAGRNDAALNSNLLSDQLKAARVRLAEEQATVVNLSTQLSERTSSLQAMERACKSLQLEKDEAIETLTRQLNEEQSAATKFRRKLEKLDSRSTESAHQLTRLARHVQKLAHKSRVTHGGQKPSSRSPADQLACDAANVDNLIASLSEMMGAYEDKVSKLNAMVSSLSAKLKSVSSSCVEHQQLIAKMETATKKAEQKVSGLEATTSRQASGLEERDQRLFDVQQQVANLQTTLQAQKNKAKAAKLEVKQAQRTMRAEDETRSQYLRSLYLEVSAMNPSPLGGLREVRAMPWTGLCSVLDSEVRLTSEQLKLSTEKVQQLQVLLRQRDDDIKRLHDLHEESLSKVTAATSDREVVWQQQKESQESHMAGLMKEVEHKIKEAHQMLANTQAELDSAKLERDKHQHDRGEFERLTEDLHAQVLALRSASGLLSSCLWPVCWRVQCISQEKAFLLNLSQQQELALQVAAELAGAVSEELGSTSTTTTSPHRGAVGHGAKPIKGKPWPSHRLHPLLAFRKLALAVMAFNRFKRIRHFSSLLCSGRDYPFSANRRLPMWVCSEQTAGGSGGDLRSTSSSQPYHQHKQQKLTEWIRFLSSPLYLSLITASSRNLCSLLQDTSGMQRGRKPGATLQLCARDQLSSLIRGLDGHFDACSVWCHQTGLEDTTTTIQVLACGLQHCLKSIRSQDTANRYWIYQQAVTSVSKLHRHVITLTQQLQAAEVQSHRHQQKVIELQQALKNANEQFSLTSKRLLSAERKSSSLVPAERFDSVCTELNAGLDREKQQQQELAEQRELALRAKHRCEAIQTEKRRLEDALQKAIHDLQDGTSLVCDTEDRLQEAKQRANLLKDQEAAMRARMSELQESLVVGNREKMALLNYLNSAKSSLDAIRSTEMSGEDVVKTMRAVALPKSKFRDGGDFSKCKDALSSLVDVVLMLARRLDAREQDLSLHAAHVKTLRRELSSACRRQLSEAAVQLAESVIADDENGYGEVDLSKLKAFQEGKLRSGEPLQPLQGQVDVRSAARLPQPIAARARPGASPHTSRKKKQSTSAGKSIPGLGADLSANLSLAMLST